MEHLPAIAARFTSEARISSVRKWGRGNINDTFVVTLARPEERYLLQRINPRVFPRPEDVLGNARIITEHMAHRLADNPGRNWEIPHTLPTLTGHDHWRDGDGFFWRALHFIDHASSHATVLGAGHAREVGRGLGMFHTLLADLPCNALVDTLPGFHFTPGYLERYDMIRAQYQGSGSPERRYCEHFIRQRRELPRVLEKSRHRLRFYPTHGDPKVDNIMIHHTSGRAVAMIDLDTVKPGLLLHDLGDCLRSGCNPVGEEAGRTGQPHFATDLCQAILHGYLALAAPLLSEQDLALLHDAIRLLAFELGLRFFTDYLSGNRYFRTTTPDQNLVRAVAQFRLTESIEAQEKTIRTLIHDNQGSRNQHPPGPFATP